MKCSRAWAVHGSRKSLSAAYYPCDGGYHKRTLMMNPLKQTSTRSDRLWSEWLVSTQKDVKCTPSPWYWYTTSKIHNKYHRYLSFRKSRVTRDVTAKLKFVQYCTVAAFSIIYRIPVAICPELEVSLNEVDVEVISCQEVYSLDEQDRCYN